APGRRGQRARRGPSTTSLPAEQAFARFSARPHGVNSGMGETARKSFVATSVAVAVIAGALAIWHLRVLVALLLLALIIAAAMRPGIELLNRHRVPRGWGVAIHYVGLLLTLGLLLWLIVPRALDQVEAAIGTLPTSRSDG